MNRVTGSAKQAEADSGLSVAELLSTLKRQPDVCYAKHGTTTAEVACLNSAMRLVRELFAMLPAKDFSPLKMGHTLAPDKKRRVAVSDEHIESVGLRLTGHHRDSFDWMLATGARPSELVNLTMANIDTRGEICVADLVEHNNARPSHHAKRLQFQKILENLIEQHPCRLQ